MKKRLLIVILAVLLFSYSCQGKDSLEEPVTMDTLDRYLDDSVRFIDLRNNEDLMRDGYIVGFENIPFFAFLENNVLLRHNQWDFTPEDIVDADVLQALFGDKNQALVLVCATGTRSAYVKKALEELGYTAVINAGGVWDYYGSYKVEGTGSSAVQ